MVRIFKVAASNYPWNFKARWPTELLLENVAKKSCHCSLPIAHLFFTKPSYFPNWLHSITFFALQNVTIHHIYSVGLKQMTQHWWSSACIHHKYKLQWAETNICIIVLENDSEVTLRELVCFAFNNIYHQYQSRGQIIGKDGVPCSTSIYAICCVMFTSNVLKDASDIQRCFPFSLFFLI